MAYIKSLDVKSKIPFSQIYPDASEASLDLLEKMLTFNPKKRISVSDALAHPYFSQLHCEEDEPICEKKFEFKFESKADTKRGIQDLLFEEICIFRPEAKEMNPLDSV